VYEAGSFVPLAQFVAAPVEGLETPQRRESDRYTPEDDPLMKVPSPNEQAQVYYYHCDVIGTPQMLTDDAGEIVWEARYKAWGETVEVIARVSAATQAQVRNPIRFQGQQADDETGLHYNRYRYYDPASGRFVSKDPIGLAGGINAFQYAPNPVSWIDPLGLAKRLCPCDCESILKESGRDYGTYSEVDPDSHHIIQNAAVRDVTDYSRSQAPAVQLNGPSTSIGSEHYIATQVQRQAGGGTYAAERRIGYKALRRAGLSQDEARCHIARADKYFSNLGVGPNTVLRVPGNR